MKIYSSEEGRVRTTAAAFIKGCLDVESEHLTPIMVSMVHCHRQADYMLDNTSKAMEIPLDARIRLFNQSKILADVIVPQEYGMFTWEKMLIGRNIVKNLLIKIDVVGVTSFCQL